MIPGTGWGAPSRGGAGWEAALRRALGAGVAVALLAVPGEGAAQANRPIFSPDEVVAMDWINLLREGRFDSAAVRVDPEVRRELNAERLDSLWSQVERRLGEVERMEPSQSSILGGVANVEIEATFEDRPLLIQVMLSPAKEVVGFTLRPVRR